MKASALAGGYVGCGLCGLVNAVPPRARHAHSCARCGSELHARKPHSIGRTWALVIAAYVLYLPANLMPVLGTASLSGTKWDTILGGVLQLLHDRAWPLAIVILVASIGVPLAKLLTLTYLLVSVQTGSPSHRRARGRAVGILEAIGRWSMIDIYVGGLLVALVQFDPLARIHPGPGAIPFGAVVVLTVLASQSFDSRLIWDVAPVQDRPAPIIERGAARA
jgi:paraquat-inducible protein A